MKSINLFGLKLSFEIKKNKYKDENIFSKEYLLREKLIYLILIMSIIAFSVKIPQILNRDNYKAGDIVKSDIYAPSSKLFRDDFKKEKIIQDIVKDVGKEYIYSPDVEKIYLENFNNFFEGIKLKKYNKSFNDFYSIENNINKKIPTILISNLTKKNLVEIEKTKDKIEKVLKECYQIGIIQEKNMIVYSDNIKNKLGSLSKEEKEIAELFIIPNYIYDEVQTKNNIMEKVSQIKDQYIEIEAGSIIAKKGEVLDARKIKILESYGLFSTKKNIIDIMTMAGYLIVTSLLFYNVFFKNYKQYILNKNYYRSSLIIVASILLIFRFIDNDLLYLIPIDTAFFLLVILINEEFAIGLFSFLLFFLLPILHFDLRFFIIYFITLISGTQMTSKIQTRSEVITTGIQLAILKVIMLFLISYFTDIELFKIFTNSCAILGTGLLSGMLTIALLPYFERTFNLLTIFRLLELGDLSHPLLKKISVEAPGTLQHSIMVATLSENAATAIGADHTFCRVASYYHDLGKVKRPKFYVENQENGENPHNSLSPFMSTLIITSHTKDGAELAKKYQIPKEIRDIMYEHQGTTFLAYFYNQAKKLDPNVDKEQFRYSGPKPRTKESAIIMLADSIEAAIRSLDEKSPTIMENMIRKIIAGKIEDNQLSEANLTFKEIEIIIKTFVKTLVSIHHVRIKYPGQK